MPMQEASFATSSNLCQEEVISDMWCEDVSNDTLCAMCCKNFFIFVKFYQRKNFHETPSDISCEMCV